MPLNPLLRRRCVIALSLVLACATSCARKPRPLEPLESVGEPLRWEQTSGPDSSFIGAIAILNGQLFAGPSNGGIHRSLDGGASWLATSETTGSVQCFCAQDTVFFAGLQP